MAHDQHAVHFRRLTMILYILTEIPDREAGGNNYVRLALQAASGDLCLVARYNQVSLALLEELRPWAVCHSGGGACYDEYDILQCDGYREAALGWSGPQIGFCGGHQLLAALHGGTLGHMGPLREDDADHNPDKWPGYYKEWGMYPVRVLAPDPLFDGLGEVIRVPEYHMDEVTALPDDFILLASSARCRVQAYRHRDKPLYGTQFHPEKLVEGYPDGKRVLDNFFAIARAERAAGQECGKV
ncbi:MAG TPA: gamma-glutamyl-gamma-aminobutyrate hydrolase family protein [Armatimonadota bacterium]|nr:gamma-glutamyl-gamma-aminobutyrate hydrolase family protein [Armatimonadota bacterium]